MQIKLKKHAPQPKSQRGVKLSIHYSFCSFICIFLHKYTAYLMSLNILSHSGHVTTFCFSGQMDNWKVDLEDVFLIF